MVTISMEWKLDMHRAIMSVLIIKFVSTRITTVAMDMVCMVLICTTTQEQPIGRLSAI